MKKLVLVATCFASVMASINASAIEKCYKAINPSSIMITRDAGHTYNDAGQAVSDISEIVEVAVAAQVKLETESKQIQDEGYTYTQNPTINIKAQSKSLKFDTTANNFDKKLKEFGVDCDGGIVTVTKTRTGLILNSDRLNGYVAAGTEGCSEGSIVFRNLKVVERKCK
ncbi:hypothetical protein [Bdellovibrio sp. HCB209]|uniref:hypothetical protein n=1 Tax=Bdellovibrio sp. HCB209 TaxID=3394354 RepID=UPI0039B46648